MRLTWKVDANFTGIKCYYGNQRTTDWFVCIRKTNIESYDGHNLWKLVFTFDRLEIPKSAPRSKIITCINIHLTGLML